MLKTLGLDDDLEPVEVVISLEKAFDVAITHREAEAIFNVGQLFDLLRAKVQPSDANRKCSSAMSFYRIRRALDDLHIGIGRAPWSDLSPLNRVYTKSLVRSIEEQSGLRLPRPALGPMGWTGAAFIATGILGSFVWLVAGLLLKPPPTAIVAVCLFFGGLVTGFALMHFDAGRLPTACRTLGDLAAKAANLSYGRLVKQGADTRDDRVWKAMVEILSDVANVPADRVARETLFLASALKSRDTAA